MIYHGNPGLEAGISHNSNQETEAPSSLVVKQAMSAQKRTQLLGSTCGFQLSQGVLEHLWVPALPRSAPPAPMPPRLGRVLRTKWEAPTQPLGNCHAHAQTTPEGPARAFLGLAEWWVQDRA